MECNGRGFPSAPQAESYPFLRLVKMRKLAFMHHATVAGHQPPAVDARRFLDPRIACDEEHRFSLEGWQGDMPVKKCIGQHVNRVAHIHAAPGASGRACGMLGEPFLEQPGVNATAGYPARALPVGVKQGFRICLGAPDSMPLNERPVPVFEGGVPADAKVRPGCALVHSSSCATGLTRLEGTRRGAEGVRSDWTAVSKGRWRRSGEGILPRHTATRGATPCREAEREAPSGCRQPCSRCTRAQALPVGTGLLGIWDSGELGHLGHGAPQGVPPGPEAAWNGHPPPTACQRPRHALSFALCLPSGCREHALRPESFARAEPCLTARICHRFRNILQAGRAPFVLVFLAQGLGRFGRKGNGEGGADADLALAVDGAAELLQYAVGDGKA